MVTSIPDTLVYQGKTWSVEHKPQSQRWLMREIGKASGRPLFLNDSQMQAIADASHRPRVKVVDAVPSEPEVITPIASEVVSDVIAVGDAVDEGGVGIDEPREELRMPDTFVQGAGQTAVPNDEPEVAVEPVIEQAEAVLEALESQIEEPTPAAIVTVQPTEDRFMALFEKMIKPERPRRHVIKKMVERDPVTGRIMSVTEEHVDED